MTTLSYLWHHGFQAKEHKLVLDRHLISWMRVPMFVPVRKHEQIVLPAPVTTATFPSKRRDIFPVTKFGPDEIRDMHNVKHAHSILGIDTRPCSHSSRTSFMEDSTGNRVTPRVYFCFKIYEYILRVCTTSICYEYLLRVFTTSIHYEIFAKKDCAFAARYCVSLVRLQTPNLKDAVMDKRAEMPQN